MYAISWFSSADNWQIMSRFWFNTMTLYLQCNNESMLMHARSQLLFTLRMSVWEREAEQLNDRLFAPFLFSLNFITSVKCCASISSSNRSLQCTLCIVAHCTISTCVPFVRLGLCYKCVHVEWCACVWLLSYAAYIFHGQLCAFPNHFVCITICIFIIIL